MRHQTPCLIAWLLVVSAVGCKRSPPAGEQADAAVVPSKAPAAQPGRCVPRSAGSVFVLGERGKAKHGLPPLKEPGDPDEDGDEGDVELGLPSAVELGNAVAWDNGYAVSALSTEGDVTKPVVALLSSDAGAGRRVELGRLHGSADPPRIALRGAGLAVAVADREAAGLVLRLAAIRSVDGPADVVWGAKLTTGADTSLAFDVSAGAQRGVLVWDDQGTKKQHSVVRAVSFDLASPINATEPRVISPAERDAQAPRIVRRSGGYWLSWVSESGAPRAVPKSGATPPEKAGTTPPAEAGDDSLLDLGFRALYLSALDENAAAVAEPIALTPADSHVLVYDISATSDGGAVLAWRDDQTVPGVESRTVHLAKVSASRAVDKRVIDDEKVGAGSPSLVADAAPGKHSVSLWLALAGVSGVTRLGALGPGAQALDDLAPEGLVKRAEPMVARAGEVLFARPRGMAMELSVLKCQAGPAAQKPPSAPAAPPEPPAASASAAGD